MVGKKRAFLFATKICIFIGVLMTSAAAYIEAEAANSILQKAAVLVGNPYKTGGTTPGGFDCSGLITYLYKPLLPNLPRLSRDMANFGKEVEPGKWKAGDILFYASGSNPKLINHVAIWYGKDALIHSVSDGPETGVIITRASSKYWRNRYISARRILPEGQNLSRTSEESLAPGKIVALSEILSSPWDDFEGILRGDFESWLENEKRDFDLYRKKNG